MILLINRLPPITINEINIDIVISIIGMGLDVSESETRFFKKTGSKKKCIR
jgi:hypothetical protein